MSEENIAPFAAAVIKLLQGIIYHDSKEWQTLYSYQNPIRDYLARIGLRLYLDEAGGFAYVMQPDAEDASPDAAKLPRLTRRYKLNYAVTVLCVLLRERLDQHESQNVELGPLYVSRDQIYEMVRVFLRDNPNEKKVTDQIDRYIGQLVEMEFLRENKDYPDYEVRPILRAKVNSEILTEIKEKLQRYQGLDDD